MGWFDGSSEVGSSSHHHHRKSSSGKHHSHSDKHSERHSSPRASSIFGLGESKKHSERHSERHSSPRASSIFGLGDPKHNSSRSIFGLGEPKHNSSRASFFGFGRSSSYYKRSPRKGYLNRIYSQLRRLLRDLVYYMKKHPMKVFMLVIMPLLTSGAVAGLLARFGIRLPGGIEKMFGAAGGSGIGRGRGGGLQFEKTKVEGVDWRD